MADLATEAQARIPAPRLKQLTNAQAPGSATSVNLVILGYAVTDAETDFQLYAEQDYDGADSRHISIGVRGVLAYLKSYAGQDDEDGLVKAFQKALKALRDTTSRARIDPYTTSTIQRSPDSTDADGVALPEFDDSHFRDLVPRPMGRSVDPDGFHTSDD